MNGKTCIVTGSNTGIGKETARGLAALGATVVLACRDEVKAQEACDDIARTTGSDRLVVMRLDLAELAAIRSFARAFEQRFDRLDVLVDNAGVWPHRHQRTKDGLELTFGVNHIGTMFVTTELLSVLKASAPARVVVVSSRAHYSGQIDWDDPMFEQHRYDATAAYYQSKLANVLFSNALASRLAGTGVTVNALHPGVIVTDLSRDLPSWVVALARPFLMKPPQGAQCSLFVATSSEVTNVTGAYFERSRAVEPLPIARDQAAQERLWELSERLIRTYAMR